MPANNGQRISVAGPRSKDALQCFDLDIHAVSRLTSLSPILLPIHPAPAVLRNVLVPNLLCQLCRRRAPHSRLAVKNHLFVRLGLAEAEAVLKFVGGEEHGVRLGFDGDVDRAGNVAGFVFCGLTDVCASLLVSRVLVWCVDGGLLYRSGSVLARAIR